MDYEKKYNEALSQARFYYGNCPTEPEKKKLENIFPELRESEDEKMMNQLHSWMMEFGGAEEYAERVFQWLKGLLEKQKENPQSADFIPSDCASDAKCEDRWHKTVNSLPDTGRDVLAKDALGNYLLASFDGAQWFVSVYDGEDHPVLHTPPILEWCEIPSEKQKEQKPSFGIYWHKIKKGEKLPCRAYVWNLDYEKYHDCFEGRLIANLENISVGGDTWYLPVDDVRNLPREGVDELPREQKHAEKQDYPGLTDLERAIHRGFLSAGVENVPVTIIKETANECKRIANENANAEWSEEDKSFYDSIMCEVIKEGMHPTPAQANWFKLLPERFNPQPHWKPSEEQEEPEYYQHFDPDC